MGLFGLFGNKKGEKTQASNNSIEKMMKESANNTAKADAQIAKLQKADERFGKDGDLNKRISEYENVLNLDQPFVTCQSKFRMQD